MSARHPSSAAFAPNVYSSRAATESTSRQRQALSKFKAAAAMTGIHGRRQNDKRTKANQEKEDERPSTFKVWVLASRPHTLTASIAPVLVGAALTSYHHAKAMTIHAVGGGSNSGNNAFALSVAWGTFACLIQLGTNMHNDYADFVLGADNEKRVGQARATQKGWLTPRQTAGGATLCLALATALGLYLAHKAGTGSDFYGFDGPSLFIVVSSVFNAVAYTGGPYPLGYVGLGSVSIGYSGLGDLFVFLYFGLVATLGVPYLYLRTHGNDDSPLLLLLGNDLFRRAFHAALPIGNFATAIIVVNNLRDRKTDVQAQKLTTAVRFGETFARTEYALLILSSYVFLFILAKSTYEDAWILPLLSLPVAMPQLEAVALGGKDGAALNEHVGGTARLQLLFCLLLVLGINLSIE
jgi:1,4-dihydroxy-2-naphthoate octaprenyltransferase